MSAPYPQLPPISDAPTAQTTRLLWERLNALQTALTAGQGSTALNLGGQTIGNLAFPTAPADAATKGYGDATYLGPTSGTGVLDALLNGALGGALQWMLTHVLPHKTIINYTAMPRYYTGTLSPDTKPILTAVDSPAFFYATDYNRLYLWTGSWQDAPGQDPRDLCVLWPWQTVGGVPTNPVPAGWALADGSTATYSTSLGLTTSGATPNIPAGTYLRSSLTTALLAGGSAGPYTPSNNSGTIGFRLGSGGTAQMNTSVNPHNGHTMATYAPPYTNVVPIVRL